MPVLVKPLASPGPRLPEPVPLGLTYIDPDGLAWAWGDPRQNVFATACAGISSPPVSLTSIGLPSGGATAQSYNATVRPIFLGCGCTTTPTSWRSLPYKTNWPGHYGLP